MMKRSELTFRVILVPLDYLAVVLAGIIAYSLRFGPVKEVRPVVINLPFREFLALDLLIGLLGIAALALGGAYSLQTGRKAVSELRRVFLGCTVALAATSFLVFLKVELISSRFIILTIWILALILVSLGHLIIRAVQRVAYRRGFGVHRSVVVGSDEATTKLISALQQDPTYGLKVVGQIEVIDEQIIDKIKQWQVTTLIDEVIIGEAGVDQQILLSIKQYCDAHHLTMRYVASLFQAQAVKVDMETIAGLPVAEVLKTSLAGWGKVFKRVFDIIISLISLIILSPFFLIIAVIIKLDSHGPVFVKLERVGASGRTFKLFKLRSMIAGADQLKNQLYDRNERRDGPLFKITNDPRITKVGKWLRCYSVDELAQLINVFVGQMSLVGPRPHEPGEIAAYQQEHLKLLTIKPGITGLAQISGRSSLKFADEARLDMYYVENWSPWLDVQILFKTPVIVLGGREAV